MLAGQVYSTISCMLKGILFSPTICSLSEVGGFLDAEELHLSLCSISHSGIYGVYRARCFTHGPALYHGAPLALHPKHYATFHHDAKRYWVKVALPFLTKGAGSSGKLHRPDKPSQDLSTPHKAMQEAGCLHRGYKRKHLLVRGHQSSYGV